MKNDGYIRVATCSPRVVPANIQYNITEIDFMIEQSIEKNADIVLFPELSVTGYTCADLFSQELLLEKAIDAVIELAEKYREDPITIVVGFPFRNKGKLYNCAAVIAEGEIKAIVPKSHIPNYREYYEKRWFVSGMKSSTMAHISTSRHSAKLLCPFGTDLLFNINGVMTGIEICEDLWVPNPPSSQMAMNGATLILNLSATNELIGKYQYLCDLISNQSARCRCAYVYASAGMGESSTDLAFAGNCIIAENGNIIKKSERFIPDSKMVVADIDIERLMHDRQLYETFSSPSQTTESRVIDIRTEYSARTYPPGYFLQIKKHPFLDENPEKLRERCEEISSIQAWGLAVRLNAINCKKAVIGISGGLDSTLALLVTVKAFDLLGYDRRGIIGVTMPGFGTTGRTRTNANALMDILGISQRSVDITEGVMHHFKDIGHNPEKHDVTYENSQARMRTMILMNIANQVGGLVIGTGDLSELALGWCTYNGDQMSMYGVNASIPKTLVKYLVEAYAADTDNLQLKNVLQDIVNTPISPELLPPNQDDTIEQKTEDLVGPYELHDFFLYHIVRYGMNPKKIRKLATKAFEKEYNEEIINHWLKVFYKRFFKQQFKRSVMPDGIKAGSVCLSPRGDWRMPSDASPDMFVNEIEESL